MIQHSVQSIELDTVPERVFDVITDPKQLPRWTNAFASVDDGRATMRTPRGEVDVELEVHASRQRGTVDWEMRFPDGSVEWAYSRVVAASQDRSVYTFVLLPPSAALESIEGALDEQSAVLAEELRRLKRLVERDG